jgi:predicted nucleic acid-binding protein
VPVIVLLDTNIWVSAFINPHGHPAELIRAWLDNQFQDMKTIRVGVRAGDLPA